MAVATDQARALRYFSRQRTDSALAALANDPGLAEADLYVDAGRADLVVEQCRKTLELALGETDEALRVLEQAYEDRILGIERVRRDVLLQLLHGHPRFRRLLARIGPPE